MVERSIRLGGYAPRDSTHSRALATIADEIESRSDLEVGVMWNILDDGRPASDLLWMVERGELTLCYFSTSYLGDRVPELNVLETPFLFDDLAQAHGALDGALGRALSEATEAKTGFRVLGYWDNGFRHLTNRLRPIRRPSDIEGMRVRLQPNSIHEAMIAAWGGEPVPVELSTGIAMIAAGDVDAQENPLANTVAYGVDRVHGHATMTGHLYGARGIYAHPATLDSLTDAEQQVVTGAVRTAVTQQRTDAAAKEDDLRASMAEAGVEFVDLSSEERDRFVEAVSDVIAAARSERPESLVELLDR